MTLHQFIERLQELERKHGESTAVWIYEKIGKTVPKSPEAVFVCTAPFYHVQIRAYKRSKKGDKQ